MADSSSAADSSEAVQSRDNRRLGWTVVIVSAAVLLLGLLVGLPYGRFSGRELNPETLEIRYFSYYRIPFTQIGISPIYRVTEQPGWAAFLIDEGYWKLAKSPTSAADSTKRDPPRAGSGKARRQSPPRQRWHLIVAGGTPADAAVFVAIMEAQRADGDNHWVAWTKEHPKTARVLWSHVATAADLELYPYVAVMLRTAEQFPKRSQFEQQMQTRLRDLLTRDLKTARERGDADRVARVARLGAGLWPDELLWKEALNSPEAGSAEMTP